MSNYDNSEIKRGKVGLFFTLNDEKEERSLIQAFKLNVGKYVLILA